MTARITDAPRPDLDPSEFTDQLDGDAMHAFTSINEHETATNAGSVRLWGSSAYPRMDRAEAVRAGYELGDAAPRVAAVGTIAGDTVAYSTGEKHPTLGLNVWQFDTLVVR